MAKKWFAEVRERNGESVCSGEFDSPIAAQSWVDEVLADCREDGMKVKWDIVQREINR